MMVYSATAGMGDLVAFRNGTAELAPYLHEFKYGTKTPELEIKMVGGNIIGYRALVIDYKNLLTNKISTIFKVVLRNLIFF